MQVDETTPLYPVIERFVSIDGEGRHAGRLAAFIRFSGCNLRCSYCDTPWAQDDEATVELARLEELVAWVAKQPCACVTITGGEPALQSHLPELIAALAGLEHIEVIELETNGSVDLTTLATDRPAKLQFTMDYKLPSSGMEAKMHTENFSLLEQSDVVKFVIGSQEDLETMASIVRKYDLEQRCSVYLSPVFAQIDPAHIVDFMKEHDLAQVTLQLQLHKIIWPDSERGV